MKTWKNRPQKLPNRPKTSPNLNSSSKKSPTARLLYNDFGCTRKTSGKSNSSRIQELWYSYVKIYFHWSEYNRKVKEVKKVWEVREVKEAQKGPEGSRSAVDNFRNFPKNVYKMKFTSLDPIAFFGQQGQRAVSLNMFECKTGLFLFTATSRNYKTKCPPCKRNPKPKAMCTLM